MQETVTSSVTISNPTQFIPLDELKSCIEECRACQEVCIQTINHCLSKGGQHSEAGHIRLISDCIEICQTTANFMLRGSPLHVRTCAVCAEVCRVCAEDCKKMPEDPQIQACVDACEACAESCTRMSQLTH